MASKRAIRRKKERKQKQLRESAIASCERKKAYATEGAAFNALRKTAGLGRKDDLRYTALHIYKCPKCSLLHIGHRSRLERKWQYLHNHKERLDFIPTNHIPKAPIPEVVIQAEPMENVNLVSTSFCTRAVTFIKKSVNNFLNRIRSKFIST